MSSSLTRMLLFFFFNDTATTEIYTLSLHDALPIYKNYVAGQGIQCWLQDLSSDLRLDEVLDRTIENALQACPSREFALRSEEHTSELQSRQYLVCRLLLEKKKKRLHYTTETAVTSV